MKKLLCLLTLAMVLTFGGRAQEITIGDGTSVVTSMAFFSNYTDSWCECTFLASELNASGNILSISLHANGNAFQCEEVDIYMGHRAADNYNSSTSFTPASDLTLVYSATSTTIGSIDGWEEYQFQTPFEYNGIDNLVVIDDSIVRGTTMRESILKILDRLHPKKIVVVSSAPQIRYPDFYGIDMGRIEEFIAFQACISLLKERKMDDWITKVYENCRQNHEEALRQLYEPFTVEELNTKMVELLRPADVHRPIELVFQSLEGLREAIPNHPGDWYFSGRYPTKGGARPACRSFVNWYETTNPKL